ncbi:hypothetical protein [Ramlibacter pallidus]|uniref:Zinc-regulated TonB-dependent outer membrane receptor n=1 Tax=Ramlibacter pallidus TaxID=2780087 RepID=A0ABR9S507_9BURK|nr:hypothetical protein [Ramlibacter pallidus]MBE7368591.1 hypothetical protein [Ramlibacter pallidus]
MATAIRRAACTVFLSSAATAAFAQPAATGWQAGAVLDLSASSRELALGSRDKGLGLGHSDVSVRGPLGTHLEAQGTAAAHTDERKLEVELEEAWIQTRTLPAGLQLRAGRFSSQIGYLNEQHPHSDDFIQRPLLYRAFLGNHWFDDGLRVNWTAPTDFYLRLGLEVFRGKQLVREAASSRRPGAVVLSSRIGGDLGRSQSWQAGLSLLHNRREAAVEAHEEGEEEEEHEEHGAEHEEHAHAHGAAFSGRRMWLAELAWKWAPEGNNRRQQVRVSLEHARVTRLNRFATSSDQHHATYLSAVWRFAPEWEVGVRHDLLRVRQPHEDHFDDGRLRETALMLAYKPSHRQTVRVQFTHQRDRGGFEAATHAVQLQYILNFGAHASHSF